MATTQPLVPSAPSPVRALTSATFDEAVRSSELPVVVDVWAPWCGPCHLLAPVVESIAGEHPDEIVFFSLDADEHPEVAARFAVMSFPTLLVFEHGELVDRLIGARGKGRLLEELAAFLSR
jgi:thioredoxin 1